MRVRLKGINSTRKKLADGTAVTYFYAWKGGPRLDGKPGTPEFIASYNAAVAERRKPASGVLFSLLAGYQATPKFLDLAARTRGDYIKQIKLIEKEFGDFPLSALADPRARGIFTDWRDRLALKSRRQADYAFTVLALILAWARDKGHITVNPCERAGRVYRGSRADKIWTEADEAAFYAKAPQHLHLAMLLALWTGQRQGDLLALTWFNYDGKVIRLRQSKTGVRLEIPVGAPLKAALDAVPKEKRGSRILLTTDGTPWTSHGFSASFRKAAAKAGIVGLTFHDMRGTAVTRLAKAGATVPQIATFTGHSLRDVNTILDSNYLHRDHSMAEEALRKLESGTKNAN